MYKNRHLSSLKIELHAFFTLCMAHIHCTINIKLRNEFPIVVTILTLAYREQTPSNCFRISRFSRFARQN